MPRVGALAMRVLALPSSTADLERLFKVAKMLTGSERRRLNVERMVRLRANSRDPKWEEEQDEEEEEEEEEEDEEDESQPQGCGSAVGGL